ncbi:MAG: diacylglycerol kinase family protein [Patescibacteria group bacterium]
MVVTGKYCFIVNPAAGVHLELSVLSEIQTFCRGRGIEHDIEVTRHPGQATDIARRAALQYGTVVAVGGDGTVNEVVNGIVGTSARLGVLPAGSGNDLAWQLGMTRSVRKNLVILVGSTYRTVDVGVINGQRYFINGFGVGFDGEVAGRVRSFLRYSRGYAAYLLAVLRTLATYRCRNVRLTIDGVLVRSQPMLFVSCCNGTTYGGGFRVAPAAKLDDRLLTVCAVDQVSRWYALRNLPRFTRGTHLSLPEVHTFTGRRVVVESDVAQAAQLDGELIEPASRFTVEIATPQITVITA